jgi:catechol 2,3-dioxygenase-like lactoylglutathione lyase family enzyme
MNSPGVHLDRIGLVMLGVKDLERAVKFYRDTLGMKVSAHMEGFAFLDAGGVTLVLSEPLAKAIGYTGGALELVFTVAGVKEVWEALGARGVKFAREPRSVSGANWAASFEDPDGNNLSIFGPEHPA